MSEGGEEPNDVVPDEELVRRAREGDERAFGELFDRHSRAVFRYAYAQTHAVIDAQELVQETYITAWRRLADIRVHGDSALPWLLVTCRNHARNLSRSQVRREALPLDERIARDGREGLNREAAEHLEELEWVFEAIHALGDVDRRIVELCLFDGMSYAAASRELGLTTSGVAKRVQRLRERLRALRDDRGEGS